MKLIETINSGEILLLLIWWQYSYLPFFVQWVPRGGLFDWFNSPVMDAGMISPLNPELVHITDDLNEAVDIALSGLM
ncbi:Uncharacterised protein [Collinsella aerofaciens]|uniref:Uncharacterized protein n=1 Tax=Collinsella aerofaciens TaxID=74426 RepID=A0A5K1J6N0_9ACTN|nr:hypothetical protein [Collinsella aerofaciens]VWL98918.1 Uncharacterised protein [Collinsella aerofaciens]